MRKRPFSTLDAFTLIEVITTMAIILVLTALVIPISSFVNNKGSRARANAEISTIKAACESYKADTGGYPMEIISNGVAQGVTDKLKSKDHFIPTTSEYANANLFLYKELTGDKQGSSSFPDGLTDPNEPRYLKEFDSKMLKANRDANSKIIEVKYIQDPWGYPYGYSTAAAREEMLFQQELKKMGSAAIRPPSDAIPGFNGATFDLWSTCGSRPASQPSDKANKELEWAKWEKNW